MAITPLIEKAVLNGWGVLRNFSVGAFGLGKIAIPQQHFGIITDFSYTPYSSAQGMPDSTVLGVFEQDAFQEVDFYVNGKSFKWTFKTLSVLSNGGGTLQHFLTPVRDFKVDTLIMADSDIFIQVKNPQMLNGGVVTDFSAPNNAQIPSAPETVGTIGGTVKTLQNVYGDKYAFPGFSESGAAAAGNVSNTVNAQNLNEMYQIIGSGQPTFNYQLPMLNVTVLMVAEQNRNFLNQRD